MRSLKIIVLFLFLVLFSCPALSKTKTIGLGSEEVKVSGYIQALYSSTQPDISSFSVARLRVDIWGDPNPIWGYLIEIDPTVSTSLIYGWVDIKSIPWFKLRVGKFYYPFGLEYSTPPSNFDTINPSNTLWKFFGFSRDIGAELLGGSNGFKYYLAVVNGNDNQGKDNNNFKDFCGRATYNFGDLTAGASVYSGLTGTDEARDRGRTGAELNYKNGLFSLKGEFISGLEETPDTVIRSQGWYVMPIVRFAGSFEALVKYEIYDPDVNSNIDANSYITYGINYFFTEDLKLQINYVRDIEEEEQIKDDTFAAQLQLSF